MGKPTHRSALDIRVASGLKVMLRGEAALAMTPAQIEQRAWVGRVRCPCGHRGWISHHRLIAAGQGARQLSTWSMRCASCGGAGELELVDPWRDNLE